MLPDLIRHIVSLTLFMQSILKITIPHEVKNKSAKVLFSILICKYARFHVV